MLGLKAQYDAAQYEGESYQYDINGNRLNHRIGGNNQLLNDGQEEYQYDAEGNRISKGNTKYFWDHRNRLVKVETPQETIEYTYDYQNRLVKRSAGKNITHFIHDGWQIVRQYENGKPIKRFLWGTKQDELLCDNDNWTLGDHLNTIREVVNSDGKVIAHCDYNAFGKRLDASSDTLQFAYTGKLTDSVTGLQWNINRWYDAEVGRWISEDPIGFNGRDENLYRYAGNTPSIKLDFNGLFVWRCFRCLTGGPCDMEIQPFKVSSYTTTHTETSRFPCSTLENAIIRTFAAVISFDLIKSRILAAVVGATSASACKCEVQFRYKTYWGKDWYGEYCMGWGAIYGSAYNYKFESFGPLEYGVYDVDTRYIYTFADKYEMITAWNAVPLHFQLNDIKESVLWYKWPSYPVGSWTGWIYP